MSTRKLNHKDRDAKDDEELQPLFHDSKWHKPEQHTCSKFFSRCCGTCRGHLVHLLFCLFLLLSFIVLVIGSFRMSNVQEIIQHPSSIPDYLEHFGHSISSIGQDSSLFDSIKAAHPKLYSKQDKARLDLSNNPSHLMWGRLSSESQPSCVAVNETYLLMVLNMPSAITANMESFVKMSTEENHFIVSHTYDFLPSHPKSQQEKTAKEKTITSYFSKFQHKTAAVSSTPYLNFEQFHLTEPVYIGTIRDPISRMQSQFELANGGHDSTRKSSKSFQDCVRAFIRNNISASHLVYGTNPKQLNSLGLPHDVSKKIMKIADRHTCLSSEYVSVQVQAYCGLECEPMQLETAEKNIYTATRNMNERFRVVLVAEQLLASVKLLEKVVPDFFTGLNRKASTMLRMFTPPPVTTTAPTPAPSPPPIVASPEPAAASPPAQSNRLEVFRCNGHKFCNCPGTMHYGKAYVNGKKHQMGGSGPMCTVEELLALPHLSKDVSATGGAMCTPQALGRDPYLGYTKQCFCDPNPPAAPTARHLRALEAKSGSTERTATSDWKLSPQVQQYLKAVLTYEYRLYASAQQHLASNLDICQLTGTK